MPLGGGVVVLYHCCVSLGMARALELVGFREDELIPVTGDPPVVDRSNPDEAFGVVMLLETTSVGTNLPPSTALE